MLKKRNNIGPNSSNLFHFLLFPCRILLAFLSKGKNSFGKKNKTRKTREREEKENQKEKEQNRKERKERLTGLFFVIFLSWFPFVLSHYWFVRELYLSFKESHLGFSSSILGGPVSYTTVILFLRNVIGLLFILSSFNLSKEASH